ncbi:MAG: hypothetical protein L3J39_13315 [Verrucomicrobiales bacterium]|nr:hypothetical protein [Verrucomicrobiales bacterium]
MTTPTFNSVQSSAKISKAVNDRRITEFNESQSYKGQIHGEADIASRGLFSTGSLSTDSASSSPIASAAEIGERDSRKESRLALSSIRQSLQGQKADAPATSNYKQLGHGGHVLSSPDNDLVTTTYKVSPSFMSAAAESNANVHAAADPFAEPAEAASTLPRRQTAKNILMEAGVTFAPGASVIYNPETSELIVRNTQDQLELVEAYKDSIKEKSNELSFPDANGDPSPKSSNFADGFQLATTADSSAPFADDASSNELSGAKTDRKNSPLGHGQTTPVTVLGESLNVPQSAPSITSAGSVRGGTVTIIGGTMDTVITSNNSSVEVNGLTGGGQITIGGGLQGKAEKEATSSTGKTNYANAATNHTRSDSHKQPAAGWVLPVPTRIRGGVDIDTSKSVKGKRDARAKVKSHENTYAGAKKRPGTFVLMDHRL